MTSSLSYEGLRLTYDRDIPVLLLGVEGSVGLSDLTPEGAGGGQLGVEDVDAVLPGVRAAVGQPGVVGVHLDAAD